jgi:hypothetical protein
MKNIIIFLFTAFLLSSCESSSVSNGRKLYKAYFKEILKDPNSFTVYNESFVKNGSIEVEWNIDYGARNSLGGMVRESVTFKTTSNKLFIDLSCYEMKGGRMIKLY